MPNLRPFRDYNEHDVVNLFSYSGTLPVNKGTIVKIVGDGWKNTDEMDFLGSPGNAFGNTVSERYGVAAKIGDAASGDSDALGVLLYDVKETDENGEMLIFNPRKAAEMNVALSGQAVPVATRGTFLYSGVAGTPAGGATAYWNGSEISSVGGVDIGKFLGAKDGDNNVLVRINL